MRMLLVLPEFTVTPDEVQRCRASMRLEIGDGVIDLAAPATYQARHQTTLGETVLAYDPARTLQDWTHVAFIFHQESGGPIPEPANSLQSRTEQTIYGFNFLGYKAQCQPLLAEHRMRHPQCSANVFMRMAPPLIYEGYDCYFPYGALWHGPGRGPLNDLGHRITTSLSGLERRQDHHKIIAVFGGSAVFSVECLHHEMFTDRLEKKLQAAARARGDKTEFTVLNFGAPRQVVLNEIMSFVLYGMPVKPDIVIAHDGFNDFMFGPPGDPALVGRHKIIYQTLQEFISHCAYQSWDISARRSMHDMMAQLQAAPHQVLRAYTERKQQFDTMVTSLGIPFIHGLQPTIFTKQQRSAAEQEYIRKLEGGMDWGVFMHFRLILQLFEQFAAQSYWRTLTNALDFTQLLRDLPSEVTHFTDLCHLNPAGDAVIANHYADYILRRILKWDTSPEVYANA